jgi:hypothetical protein
VFSLRKTLVMVALAAIAVLAVGLLLQFGNDGLGKTAPPHGLEANATFVGRIVRYQCIQ